MRFMQGASRCTSCGAHLDAPCRSGWSGRRRDKLRAGGHAARDAPLCLRPSCRAPARPPLGSRGQAPPPAPCAAARCARAAAGPGRFAARAGLRPASRNRYRRVSDPALPVHGRLRDDRGQTRRPPDFAPHSLWEGGRGGGCNAATGCCAADPKPESEVCAPLSPWASQGTVAADAALSCPGEGVGGEGGNGPRVTGGARQPSRPGFAHPPNITYFR